jgi:hypothetical protein
MQMVVDNEEVEPTLPVPAKAPWETPRVVEASIKEHTAYYVYGAS